MNGFDVLFWMVILLSAPFLIGMTAYIIVKMGTYGYLNAKKHFNQVREEERNGQEKDIEGS